MYSHFSNQIKKIHKAILLLNELGQYTIKIQNNHLSRKFYSKLKLLLLAILHVINEQADFEVQMLYTVYFSRHLLIIKKMQR